MSPNLVFNGIPLHVTEDGRIFRDGREYKLQRCKLGYLFIGINNGPTRKRLAVHRAVAMTYLERSDGKPDVNHKDGNKENNTVQNLEWISKSDNSKHAYRTGLFKNRSSRWDKELEMKILALRAKKMLQIPIAEELGISQYLVSQVLRMNGDRRENRSSDRR